MTCVFTNVQRGTITIIKNAQPDSDQDFAFTASGAGLSGFSLDDDGDNTNTLSDTQVFTNLVAGAYSVTESDLAGWDLSQIDCNALGGSVAQADIATGKATLTLANGGSIVCIYTNSKPAIQIVKTAGTAADGTEFVTPAGPVTYTYVVTNTGPVSLSSIVVTDDNGTPGSLGDDFTVTCPKAALAAGASMTCTATVTVTANRTNIGTVTGTSGGGTTVTDTDDAVVRVPSVNIDKSADDHLVEPNQVVTYTLNVQVVNGPLHDAVVTDTLPVGQTYVADSSTPSEPTVSVDGRTLTWDLGTLDSGDPAVTITYKVKIDGNATVDPQNNVAKICVSELPLCDQDDETVTPEKPEIQIVKTAGTAADGKIFDTSPGPVTYTYVVTNTGPLPLKDVTVRDDNGTPGTLGDDFAVTCPKTTLAVDELMTCTATIEVIFDKTNIATAHGVTAEGNPVEDTDDAVVRIVVIAPHLHGLFIDKSNNAPIEHLELPNGTFADLPTAKEGSTVTFTLDYTFSDDPVTNGVITDVLPVGSDLRAQLRDQQRRVHLRGIQLDHPDPDLERRERHRQWHRDLQGHGRQGRRPRPAARPTSPPSIRIRPRPTSDTSDVFVPAPPGETQPTLRRPTRSSPTRAEQPGHQPDAHPRDPRGHHPGIGFVTPVPATVRRRNRR